MDLLTQLQGHVKAVAATLTNTVGYLNNQSPSVPFIYNPEHLQTQELAQQAEQLVQLLMQSKFWKLDLYLFLISGFIDYFASGKV